MNSQHLRTICILGVFLLLAPPRARADTIRLICAYSHSISAEGKQAPTSGETFFVVDFDNAGVASIKKEGLGARFAGTVSEDEINAEAKYSLGDLEITETLFINRYTGAMTLAHSTQDGRGLVFYGKCRTAKEKLF